MNKLHRFVIVAALGLLVTGAAAADTLELKNGRVLHGKYLGGTQVVLRFEINGEVQTFNTYDIVALTFTGRSGSAAAPVAPGPPAAPSEPPAPAPPSPVAATTGDGDLTIPAGQSLLVRMIDGVD